MDPNSLYECPECKEKFSLIVWHCDKCAHHWPVADLECRNCHAKRPKKGSDTASKLAEAHGVSRATIIRDGKRAEEFDKLAKTHPEQAKAVMEGKKRFNEVRREIKREEVKAAVKLPDAKFRVLYADPPGQGGGRAGPASVW